MFENKIVVIGDSHVRAFSYNIHFIPLNIGPAAFNNFLSEKSAEVVRNKIDLLFTNLKEHSVNVLFLFSGDIEHLVRKSSGFNDIEKEFLAEAIIRYHRLIDWIRENYNNVNVLISAVLPGTSNLYSTYQEYYNEKLHQYCVQNDVEYIDINASITDENNLLKYPYKADFAHISYRTINHYVRKFLDIGIILKTERTLENDYTWRNIVDIDTEKGPFKIWGDIYRDELIADDYESIPWDHIKSQSKMLAENTLRIVDFCQNYLKVDSFTVGNCGEGFLVFEILKNYKNNVNGFDLSQERIINAKVLQVLSGFYDCQLEFLNPDNQEFKWNEVVVDFGLYDYKEAVRNKLLGLYNIHSKYVFLLSRNVRNDRRLLKKSGYSHTEVLLDLRLGLTLLVASNKRVSSVSKFNRAQKTFPKIIYTRYQQVKQTFSKR